MNFKFFFALPAKVASLLLLLEEEWMPCWDYDNIAQVQLAFAVAAGNNHNNNASADVDAAAALLAVCI